MLPQGVIAFLPRLAPAAEQALKPAFDLLDSLPPTIIPFPARHRANRGLGPSLGRSGSLEVRLASSAAELRAAQRLRYRVFFEEKGATPNARQRLLKRDVDAFDASCDHLIVVDHALTHAPKVVGAYRLLRQDRARQTGFYTQGEFDVDALIRRHPSSRFLELGRSCVLPEYRSRKTVELLWHGIWAYVRHHRIDVMFGCASLEGTDAEALGPQLSLLAGAGAQGEWRARAHPVRRVPMTPASLDGAAAKAALRALPPLLKGYLRLGAMVGDGAVIDPAFGVTDVLIILPVDRIDPRYVAYYGADGERYAA